MRSSPEEAAALKEIDVLVREYATIPSKHVFERKLNEKQRRKLWEKIRRLRAPKI